MFLKFLTGKEESLKRDIANKTPTNFVMKLYINDRDPNINDTESNYIECSVLGYSSQEIDGLTDFTISQDGADYKAETTDIRFEFDEQVTIYGYYLVTTDNIAIGANKFEEPYISESFGGHLDVKHTIYSI